MHQRLPGRRTSADDRSRPSPARQQGFTALSSKRLTIDDEAEFCSLVLETKPTGQEKTDFVAFMRQLQAETRAINLSASNRD